MRLGQRKPAQPKRHHTAALWIALIAVILVVLIGMDQGWRHRFAPRIPALVQGKQTCPLWLWTFATPNTCTLGAARASASHRCIHLARPGFCAGYSTRGRRALPVEIRLMEGPAQRLGDDDKWSYDVRTQEDQTTLGCAPISLDGSSRKPLARSVGFCPRLAVREHIWLDAISLSAWFGTATIGESMPCKKPPARNC